MRRAASLFLYLMAGLAAWLTYMDMLGLVVGMVLGGVLILAAFAVRIIGVDGASPH